MAERRALGPDVGLFLVGGALLFAVVRGALPPLAQHLGVDPFAVWMALALVGVFGPVTALAWVILRAEGPRPIGRLRFGPLSRADWRLVGAGALTIVLGSTASSVCAARLGLEVDPFWRPPRPFEPWMFGLAALYWPVNILGEEFAWRGVVLPRMEARLGARAWVLNGALWGVFHAAFGVGNLVVLIPSLAVVPFVAQRSRNSWAGVILHATLSLPGMLMIATGRV